MLLASDILTEAQMSSDEDMSSDFREIKERLYGNYGK